MKTRHSEEIVKILHSDTTFTGCEVFTWCTAHKTPSFGETYIFETFVLQMLQMV